MWFVSQPQWSLSWLILQIIGSPAANPFVKHCLLNINNINRFYYLCSLNQRRKQQEAVAGSAQA